MLGDARPRRAVAMQEDGFYDEANRWAWMTALPSAWACTMYGMAGARCGTFWQCGGSNAG